LKLIKNYIKEFVSRSGNLVLLSTLFSKGFSFLGSLIALKLIDNKELGIILFAFSIVQFITPIGGFGLHQSLIRYGALLKSIEEKEQLFSYVLKKGIIVTLLLILVLIVIGSFINFQFENTYYYFSILSFSILSVFIFEVVKIKFRLLHQNSLFAKVEFIHSIILLILIFILSKYFNGLGYVIALISTPLLSSLFFIRTLNINYFQKTKLTVARFSFWKYGFFGGMSSMVTQLLFIIDIILIGYLLDDPEKVTNYRYISVIPFSLLFLPRVFIATDFVTFTERVSQKKYIQNYIKSYMQFFGIISILLFIVSYFFKDSILSIFGKEFISYSDSFLILIIGIIGIYIFRGIFGNLLCSIGKIEYNYYIISIAILINIISNYFLIPLYGIKGAAITSAILMWFTGILSWVSFVYFYRKENYE